MSEKIRFPLETPRLVVRPLVLADAEALHELFTDAEAMQFLTSDLPQSLEESRRWVQSKIDKHEAEGLSLWAVVERQTGAVVGDAGLQWEEIDGVRELDLGCRVIPRFWGRGYGTEASAAVLAAAFEQLGVERVTAMTARGNGAARRVLEKLGLRYERDVHAYGFDMALYAVERPGTG